MYIVLQKMLVCTSLYVMKTGAKQTESFSLTLSTETVRKTNTPTGMEESPRWEETETVRQGSAIILPEIRTTHNLPFVSWPDKTHLVAQEKNPASHLLSLTQPAMMTGLWNSLGEKNRMKTALEFDCKKGRDNVHDYTTLNKSSTLYSHENGLTHCEWNARTM